MSRLSETHRQQLKVRESQQDHSSDEYVGETPLSDDFEGKLEFAQQQLENLQAEQERIERQKVELAELNTQKEEFLHGQVEISEKLAAAITAIDRGMFDMRQEMEDLEQTKASFTHHLAKIEKLNPDSWTRENLKNELNRAISNIDLAEDEYEQAVSNLNEKDSGNFNSHVKAATNQNGAKPNDFQAQFLSGLAFNLPLIILGAIALLVYIF